MYGIMISAMVCTLQLLFGSVEPSTKPELWHHSWNCQVPQQAINAAADSEDNSPGPLQQLQLLQLGLHFCEAVRDYGTIWLPVDMVLWESLPCFKP